MEKVQLLSADGTNLHNLRRVVQIFISFWHFKKQLSDYFFNSNNNKKDNLIDFIYFVNLLLFDLIFFLQFSKKLYLPYINCPYCILNIYLM